MKDQVSGAGPRNISEILTQSRLSPLARRVSVKRLALAGQGARAWKLTQLVSTTENRWSVVESTGKYLEEADWNIAILERKGLAKIAASSVDSCSV